MKTLGEIIEYQMRQKNMTMKQLGEEVGKTEASISLYIANKAKPRMGVLQKISETLDVDLSILANAAVENFTDTLTPVTINFDDFFPLHYAGSVSAGSFEEFINAEPDAVVYVPIKYQSIRKNLHAFKVCGESMNNVIPNDAIVIVYDLLNNARQLKNGDIVVAFLNGEATVKRFYEDTKTITLMPDSNIKSFLPIVLSKEDDKFQIVGNVVWFSNPDDVMEKL